nr:hypothetical protein GCM10020092_045070 [Actinoplanes digitatis]
MGRVRRRPAADLAVRCAGHRPPPDAGADVKGPTAVVGQLLAYGRRHAEEQAGKPVRYTPHAAANALVLGDPFAFLLAVIFDQGIPAERAWRAPYDLRQRLGHLDPATIAADPGAVADAVARAPALHRYVNTVPNWLVAAGRTVCAEYHGQAATSSAPGSRGMTIRGTSSTWRAPCTRIGRELSTSPRG